MQQKSPAPSHINSTNSPQKKVDISHLIVGSEAQTIQRMYLQKIELLRDTGQKLKTRDIQINTRDAALKLKDAEIKRLMKELDTLKKEMGVKSQSAGELHVRLQSMQDLISQRDEIIDELEEAIERAVNKIRKIAQIKKEFNLDVSVSMDSFVMGLNKSSAKHHSKSVSILKEQGSRSKSRILNESNASMTRSIMSQALDSCLLALEQRLRQINEELLKKNKDITSINLELSVTNNKMAELQRQCKLLQEQLDESEKSKTRLQEKDKTLEEILQKAQKARMTMVEEAANKFSRAMTKESESSPQQLLQAKRILQRKVDDLDSKVKLLTEQNLTLKVEGATRQKQMLQRFRRLQRMHEETVQKKEMEMKLTTRTIK